jgi:hypothetical protein
MPEDESQTKDRASPKLEFPDADVEIVIPPTQGKKEPLQPGQPKSPDWKVLERAKARTPEHLWNQYCGPITRYWPEHERNMVKDAALKILGSEFAECIEGDGLKGHAKHKTIYPVYGGIGDLIIALVKYAHFAILVNLPYLPPDLKRGMVIKEFDEHFRVVAALARRGGVKEEDIQSTYQQWRWKISAAVVKGKITAYWDMEIENEIYPGKWQAPKAAPHVVAARVFAEVFIAHLPPKTPSLRIAEWVNIILKSLGREPASVSGLRSYIKEERHKIAQLPESKEVAIE